MKNTNPQLLSVAEAAKELRTSAHRVGRMCNNREIAFIRIGETKRLIPRSALEEWKARATVQPRAPS